jgi:hypothetical protein
MPRFVAPDGSVHYIPDVYSMTDVVTSLPGPLPDFLIPILIGGDDEGVPYNVDSLAFSEESKNGPFRGIGTPIAIAAYFGPDGDLMTSTKVAKRHGMPFFFACCASALTRASVDVTGDGDDQYTLYAKKYGAPGGHAKVKIASGTTITVTPVKYRSLLTADALTGSTRLYVKDNTWVRVGQSLSLGSNAENDTAFTVKATGTEPSATGQIRQYIDLTTATGADFLAADYALIVEWDTTRTETSGVCANVQAQIDWFNSPSSSVFGAHKLESFTNPAAVDTLASATVLKEIGVWEDPVPGTSPAPTSGGYSALITQLDGSSWDQFAELNKVLPRAFCILDSSSTVHQAWRDWSISKRTEGYPVSVNVGCGWGDVDVDATDDTSPVHRAQSLNNEDVQLAAGGLDQLGAHLSLSPALWALRCAGGVGHNLTNDGIVYSTLEVQWDERNLGELTALCKAGVATYRLSVAGVPAFVISEGLNTLQNNAVAWNVVSKDTPLVMQRDLADFVDRTIKGDLNGQQVGADRVTPDTIAAVVSRRAEKSLERRGYLQKGGFTINSIVLDESGAGYDVEWSVKLPVTNDFIGLTTHIVTGS